MQNLVVIIIIAMCMVTEQVSIGEKRGSRGPGQTSQSKDLRNIKSRDFKDF